MRRALLPVLLALLMLPALPVSAAAPSPTPSASPNPCAAPSPSSSPTPSPTPGDQTAAELQAACERQQQLDQVRQQLGDTIASSMQALDQLRAALEENRKQQEKLQGQIEDSNAKIADLEQRVAKLEVQIAETERRIELERQQLASLARAIYARPDSILVDWAEAGSLGDFLDQMSEYGVASQHAEALRQRLTADNEKLKQQREQLISDRAKLVAQRDQLQAQLQTLQQLAASQEQLATQLAQKIDQTKQELAKVGNQQVTVAKQIADLLQQQQNELLAASVNTIWQQALSGTPTGGFPVSKGHSKQYRFIWPESTGVITQGFGPSTLAFEPPYQGYAHFHTGIDIAAPAGTPVMAADDGIVVVAGAMMINGQLAGYGNYVVIAHAGGLETLYGHLQTVMVKPGDAVSQGQPIGLEGSTGYSTGPHCHFEVRTGGQMQDPTPYLPPGAPSPVRL